MALQSLTAPVAFAYILAIGTVLAQELTRSQLGDLIGQMDLATPLSPLVLRDWAAKDNAVANPGAQQAPRCVQLDAATWGLGCTLNNWWAGIALLRLETPGLKVYFDYSPSPYKCEAGYERNPLSISPFFVPELIPPFMTAATGHQNPPEGCTFLDIIALGMRNQAYSKQFAAWVDAAPAHPQRFERLDTVRRAMLEAVCPIAAGFWAALRPDVRNASRAAVAAALEAVTEPYVVLNLRGGDKAREYGIAGRDDERSMSRGMAALAAAQPGAMGRTCFLVGDDAQLGQIVQNAAGRILGCKRFVSRLPDISAGGHQQKHFNDMPHEQRCDATKRFLADLDLMAGATYYVGATVSNVAMVVLWLRSCVHFHPLDTFVDADGLVDWKLWF